MRRRSRTLWVALGRSGTLLGRSGALWDARRRAARIRSGGKLVPLQIQRPRAEGRGCDRRQGHNRGHNAHGRRPGSPRTTTGCRAGCEAPLAGGSKGISGKSQAFCRETQGTLVVTLPSSKRCYEIVAPRRSLHEQTHSIRPESSASTWRRAGL